MAQRRKNTTPTRRKTCSHGQPLTHNLKGHPHKRELGDPQNFGILAFYSFCDCCGIPMHTDSPYPGGGIMQQNKSLFCDTCDKGKITSRK